MRKIWENYSYTILLIGLFVFSTIILANQIEEIDLEDYYTITIQKGDTLWDIAQKYNENDDFTYEEFIEWVKKENDIYDYIYPGDTITIPIKREKLTDDLLAANDLQD